LKVFPVTLEYRALSRQLTRFYDFTDKVVLYVGAGGRQLLDLGTHTKKTIAIEQDSDALRQLEANIASRKVQDSVEVVASSFEQAAASPGDVVYFEFCLHEMADPFGALVHARSLAPDIVIFDHLADSPWSFYAAEDERVRRAGEAAERFGIRRGEKFETTQRFTDYGELHQKLDSQGPVAIGRAWRDFDGRANIAIPMRYYLALL
jgi:hypothetical protein